MENIGIMIAILSLVLTSVGLGLQFASYINESKNDRPTSNKCDR